ncbi:hypothetical protein PMAYCL1PPCAC_08701, partial [Pristionchus mayeri]
PLLFHLLPPLLHLPLHFIHLLRSFLHLCVLQRPLPKSLQLFPQIILFLPETRNLIFGSHLYSQLPLRIVHLSFETRDLLLPFLDSLHCFLLILPRLLECTLQLVFLRLQSLTCSLRLAYFLRPTGDSINISPISFVFLCKTLQKHKR